MKLKFTGNGISMESAIFFLNAYSRMSFLRMQLAYIRAHGAIIKNKYIEITEDAEYIIYLTQKGLVWFRMPLFKKAEIKA